MNDNVLPCEDEILSVVRECKYAYADGNMALAWEKWVDIHYLAVPEEVYDMEQSIVEERHLLLQKVMREFSSDEIFDICGYSKESTCLDEEELDS